MRVGFIGCSKEKLKTDVAVTAASLYTGPLFKAAKRWIEKRTELDEWAILSAKHGVLLPGDFVAPYDLCLDDMTADERARWAMVTRAQIVDRWSVDTVFMVVAGAHYRTALDGLPYVEDVIHAWGQWRREKGLRPAHCSIGVLLKYLREGKPYGS